MGTDGFRVGIGFRVLGLRSFTCETRGGLVTRNICLSMSKYPWTGVGTGGLGFTARDMVLGPKKPRVISKHT